MKTAAATRAYLSLSLGAGLLLLALSGRAQTQGDSLAVQQLKKMSIEELMNLEVVSVSRRPEKLTEAASAVQVITREDIRRSGATNVPEALRLVTNLQVAQITSYAHIISARGFNALFSNKLLVMIDGRTVYSPLFAGVFWDAQNLLLEDIERIEVISGPGGALWGANAVNGVINIITRKATDTEGLYASFAAGTYLHRQAALRYGGKLGKNISYRVFAQHSYHDDMKLPDGGDANDALGVSHGGLRMDWRPGDADEIMLKANVYGGTQHTDPENTLDGQNIQGRWIRRHSDESVLVLQAYFDRSWRRAQLNSLNDELYTYDLDLQHRFRLAKRHQLMWGIGYRLQDSHIKNTTEFAGFLPNQRNMQLFSSFIQDEISLKENLLKLTLGSKFQHHEYTGFEWQPSARLAYTPQAEQILWAGVSRAVRTPSRIDRDYHIPAYEVEDPMVPQVDGGPNFESEKVIAYEAGYRIRPIRDVSLSLASFFNRYYDLYSVENVPNTQTYQIMNGTEGKSWGAEFFGTWQVLNEWRLRAGYTYFRKDLDNKPGRVYDFSTLGNDARNQLLLQSIANLPADFQFDVVLRYLSETPLHKTPAYFTFDARLAWTYNEWMELSVVGQNLWEGEHAEWVTGLPRGVYGRLTCRF